MSDILEVIIKLGPEAQRFFEELDKRTTTDSAKRFPQSTIVVDWVLLKGMQRVGEERDGLPPVYHPRN